MENLTGKVALVTGGASGIGFAIAQSLANAGARIVVGDIDVAALMDARTRLEAAGADVLAVELDVTRVESWRAAVDTVEARAGGIDVLCNNAGVGPAVRSDGVALGVLETSEALWRLTFDINATGAFLGVRAVAPLMIRDGRVGHIVNTASMAGLFTPPGLVPYSASKFALVALSEGLRAELAPHGVGVSILCPGAVESRLSSTSAARRASIVLERAESELSAVSTLAGSLMKPASVGERVVAAIRANAFYVLTHPEYEPLIEERFEAVRAAIGSSAEPGHADPARLLERSRNPAYADAVAFGSRQRS